jgi:LPS-assembly protein
MKTRFFVRKRRFFILLSALCAFSLGPPSSRAVDPAGGSSAPQEAGGAEVRIVARSKEITKDRVFAAGAVEIHYKEMRIFADRVEYGTETKDVLAEGNVVIELPDEIIRAERAVFNLDTGRGKVEKSSGMIQPSFLFTADAIERAGEDLYDLSGARVTSCTQPVPRWDFSFSRAVLRKEISISMWNAVLRVKRIPVFYLPYLRYPLEDRATGFLMPQIGFSGPKGFVYSQSFYWAIARNMDATVGLDYYPSEGLGAGLQYRYLLAKGTGGQVDLYHFIFRKATEGTSSSPDSVVRLSHNQALPLGFTLAASVDYQTSFDFLREYDENFRQASVSNRSAQAYLSRSWSHFNVSARASRFETYYSELDDSIVNTSLPQVNFNVFKVKIFSPLYFSMTGGFNNWRYGWRSQYEDGSERRSSALTASPSLSLPFTSIPWLTANTSVTANFAYYGESLIPGTTEIVDEPLFTKNVAVNVNLTGPVFYRIYYGRNGEPRLKNVIEPYLNYTYESPISQPDRLVTPYGFYRYHQMA